MQRKYLTILLITATALLLFACGKKDDETQEDLDNVNETGMPIVDEPIELDFFARQSAVTNEDWNDVLVFNEYEDMTNIKVNFKMTPDNIIEEKLNLTLGGGDMPDAFHTTFMSDNDMMKYGEQGVFIPLNDLIDDYAPNLKKVLEENPIIEQQITFPDGNIYGFPKITDEEFFSYRTKEKPWIKDEWLEKVNMDIPETTEEFHDFLTAVQEHDADITPYGGREIAPLLNFLKGSFGVGTKGVSNANIDEDPDTGELRFFPTSDNYKELLEFMNTLYEEELIAQNIFSIEDDQYRANVSEGKYASTVFFNPVISVGGDNVNDFTGMPALEGPNGDRDFITLSPLADNKSAFVITNENEHPVATVRWIDHFYSEEGMELFFMGLEGETFEYNDDGDPEYIDEILNSPEGNSIPQEQAKYLTFGGGGFPSITNEKYFQGTAENSEEAVEAAATLEPFLIDDPWPPFIYTEDEIDQLNRFGSDIDKYVSEMQDKFISGEASFDEWDDYVNKFEKMNLDEYMDIKQAALDRFEDN